MLVDTHCHLGDAAFDADRAAVVAAARGAGVGHVIVVAETIAASGRARGLAETFGYSATAGVHPHTAGTWSADAAAAIRAALSAPAVVAVGETGLDYHYEHAPRPAQRAAFEGQLALAAELGCPVVVHSRDADGDMAALVRAWGGHVTLVLHSFSAGAAVFEAAMAVGAYCSFSGMVTFRTWRGDAWVRDCPPERLLLETDAPYLTPVPHRGARNEPAYVTHVAARVAALRGTTPTAIAELTTANAARCFGPRVITPTPSEPA